MWLMLVLLLIFGLFSFVILFGAPYLPTLKKQQVVALELLDLKPGQTFIELGSGDGRLLKAAAKRGIKSIGYEINPVLVLYSKLISWRYRHLVTIKWRNFWRVNLPACDGIYVFFIRTIYEKTAQKNYSRN